MLPSKQRLSRLEFNDFLAQKGVSVVFNSLGTLKFIKTPENKASVVISSKNEKKAVLRNKLKRRVYKVFSGCFTRLSGYQFVLYASKQATKMDYKQVNELLDELIKKATK
jgi:ribonuclease P protein component